MKRGLELGMGILLLAGVFFLGREEAAVVGGVVEEAPLVMIDAGHGGEDPGKVGVGGTLEKDLNLAIAGKLKEYLEKNGIRTELTRTGDEGLNDLGASNKKVQDLQRRCQKIHEAAPECVVSIHQNSYPEESVKGAQVFYYTHSLEGKQLAEKIQKHLVEQLDPENRRQAKGNGTYYMLKNTEAPLVIVECGFLSSREEEKKLVSEEYQELAARAVGDGVLEYLTGKKA